ncbi:MAG: type III-A CRISPR-associated RAMP protein Csm3 [Bacteroidota bacterium]
MPTENANPNPKFKGNVIIKGKIECLTGIHIGGSKDKLEIGGVDAPVIRNPQTRMPYIPGSSLKGKMRHLLEYALGVVGHYQTFVPGKDRTLGDVSQDDNIVRLFGIGANDKRDNNEKLSEHEKWKQKVGPSRLIFRDCYPDQATEEMWDNLDSDLLYTEYKPENTINRVTAAANPRFMERVVAGSKFEFEMLYTIIEMDEDQEESYIQKDLDNLMRGLRLLEHNFIGKSGTRGYGKIQFLLADPITVTNEDYLNGGGGYAASMQALQDDQLKNLANFKVTYKL